MSTPTIPDPDDRSARPSSNAPTPRKRARGSGCPLCGKPPSAGAIPFCSPGCRDRDLIAWLGDGYRVPGLPTDEDGLENDDARGLDSDA